METAILYEDTELVVCCKPAGIPTQTKSVAVCDMVSILKKYEKSSGQSAELFVVHRLDQPVEGVMVFAKTKKAAASLSAQAAGSGMKKKYLAVLEGQIEQRHGTLEHMLLKDGRTNCSNVVAAGVKGAKKAVLSYEVLETSPAHSLVLIELSTGRHHQIRAQFAACGHPLLGDVKYGAETLQKKQSGIALCAVLLSFVHPCTGVRQEYKVKPSGEFFKEFTLKALESGRTMGSL